ncbi:MAG: hypothetical protein ABEK04_06255 [Candidatus Nanohalobium sp.]
MNKMGIVVLIVMGLLVALIVTSSSSGIFEDAKNETEYVYNESNHTVNYGVCVNNCRRKWPSDVSKFEQCKASRCPSP